MAEAWEIVYKPLVEIIRRSPDRPVFISNFEEIAQKLLRTNDYVVKPDAEDSSKTIVITHHQGKIWQKSYTFPALVRSFFDRWRKEGSNDFEELADVMESFGLLHISDSIRGNALFQATRSSSRNNTFSFSSRSTSRSSRYTPSPTPELSQSTNDDTFGRKIGNGNIRLDEKQVLGEGSNGEVFMGSFDGRKVAIKTINVLPMKAQEVEKEIEILLKCDDHENIVKYFGKDKETHVNIVTYFIAIELCQSTLKEWTENRDESLRKLDTDSAIHANATPLSILKQVSKGLSHLHQRAEPIIHRDLKPENILLQKMSNGQLRVKLTDFGISRIIPEGKTRVTLKTSSGTFGWMAPEVFQVLHKPQQKKYMSKETDIFSLGCVFYYVLTDGMYPFSLEDTEDYKPEIDFDLLKDISYYNYSQLIRLMVSMEPRQRPSIQTIVNHHIFWSNKKRLQFLCDISSLCDQKEWELLDDWLKENHAKLADTSRSKFTDIYSDDKSAEGWLKYVTENVKKNLLKKIPNVSRYKGQSVRELVRAIRNFKEHYNQEKGVQEELGKPPDVFLGYWTERFPFLIDLVWTAACSVRVEKLVDDVIISERIVKNKLNGYFKDVDYDFANAVFVE